MTTRVNKEKFKLKRQATQGNVSHEEILVCSRQQNISVEKKEVLVLTSILSY